MEERDHGIKNLDRPQLAAPRTILWMGLLAVLPYVLLFLSFSTSSHFPSRPNLALITFSLLSSVLTFILLIICIFCGFLFGLIGIIRGVKISKQLQSKVRMPLSLLLGISLGVMGVMANLWFFIFYIPSVLAVL